MSNSDLRSRLSALQSDLNAIQRENARLQGEINAVTGAIGAATRALVSTHNHITSSLDNDNARLVDAHNHSIAAYELQGEISRIYERLKRMELANKRIRECNNRRYYDFATYRQVRKIVQGSMDNLDFHMVNAGLIDKAIEKKHLQTPDFWLTCVLLSIVAWKDDAPELASRAINQAMALDTKRTAAFLLIFNLRMGRDEAAVKWFELLKGLELVGADRSMILLFFSLLSRTIQDKVSEATRESISTYVRQLMTDSMGAAGYSEADVVERARASMSALCSDWAFDYPLLQHHCVSPDALRVPFALARNNRRIIEFFAAIMQVDDSKTNEYLKEYIDEVVAAPCAVEQDVYDEIERNEAIIRFQGDLEAAEAAELERKTRDVARLDVVEEMLRWVFDPAGAVEANPQMRLNMLTLLKTIELEGATRYIEGYRAGFITRADVTVGDFAVNADFEDIAPACAAAKAHCDEKCAADQAGIKDTTAYILFVAGAVMAVAAFFTTLALLVLAVAGLAAGAGYLFYNKSEREKVTLKYDSISKSLQSSLEELAAEYKRYARDYAEHDTLSDRLIAQLESL